VGGSPPEAAADPTSGVDDEEQDDVASGRGPRKM